MAGDALLLIEDDKVLSRAIVRVLRHFGTMRVVATVADARRALDAQSWRALLVDVGLPDGSGLDVLTYARAAKIHTPALVVTGWGDSKTANRAFELGAALVRKPVEVALLQASWKGCRIAREKQRISKPPQPPKTPRELSLFKLPTRGAPATA
jgi:DNA-binding response OmpR family regulator